jgi:hypothetical protein
VLRIAQEALHNAVRHAAAGGSRSAWPSGRTAACGSPSATTGSASTPRIPGCAPGGSG